MAQDREFEEKPGGAVNLPPEGVLDHFPLRGRLLKLERVQRGLIHDTYHVVTTAEEVALQLVNSSVFPKPEATVTNLLKVLPFVERVVLPEPIPTREGAPGFRDGKGGFWRVLRWLRGRPLVRIDAEGISRLASGLARLHLDLAKVPPALLSPTLPHFHELPFYLNDYDRFDPAPLGALAERIERLRGEALALYLELKRLPRQITHGDPKLDNFLLLETWGSTPSSRWGPPVSTCLSGHLQGDRVAWLDLDTLQPGWLWVDLADALRSLLGRLGRVDLEAAALFLRVWLAEAGALLTQEGRALLPESLWLIPFELAVRFATDLLSGRGWFKLTKGALLERTCSQLALAEALKRGSQELLGSQSGKASFAVQVSSSFKRR